MANMPQPPAKPPSRPGNSQQMTVQHDAAQQRNRPREVHPAVTEFQNRYAQIWDENDRLREENARLIHETDVLRKLDVEKSGIIESLRAAMAEAQKTTDMRLSAQELHFRERLAETERAKERYLRYAVGISTDIKSAIANLEAADQTAMEMAHSPADKALDDVQKAIADAARAEHGS